MNNDLQISTRVRRLFNYLDDFEKGNIQVPLFQRDFVWDNSQKLELLDSIKKGYPIGSILFWRPISKFVDVLSDAELQTIGAYKLPKKNADFFYILDGYQRLSTLFGCLVNPAKTKLKRNEEDWQKNFDIIYNLEEDNFSFNRKKSALELYEVPVFKFIDGEEFYEFQTKLIKLNVSKEKVDIYLKRYKNFGTKISTYDIPSIDLIGGTITEAVDIFSRLNSRGEPISNVWKISALSYNKEKDFRLGTEIDGLLTKLKAFNFFNKKSDKKNKRKLILQCLTSSFGDVYFDTLAKNDQNALEKLALRNDFIPITRKTFKAIEKTVQFLYNELNVIDSKLLPYGGQFIFITDFFNKIDTPNTQQLQTLKQWFWITTYSNYFTRYNLSKQRSAYDKFQDFIENQEISPVYYDKKNALFETIEFPSKIYMGSVRAKALALFMLYFQEKETPLLLKRIPIVYKTYKLFKEKSNISENTILVKSQDISLSKSSNHKSKKDLSDWLQSSNDYTKFFITEEMKSAYQEQKSMDEILAMRKKIIIKSEKEFVDKLDLTYIE